MRRPWIKVAGAVALILLIGVGVYIYTRGGKPLPAALSTADYIAAATSTRDVPAGYKEYKNFSFHISLFYSSDLAVKEYQEQGNALTVTFQNLDKDEEFQIFATPYTDTQVTDARFKLDEPSGVRDQPIDVLIDGTEATAFFSSNPVMGDTREVWFIHGGLLYEVTTYKELDSWLANIMQSWKFI